MRLEVLLPTRVLLDLEVSRVVAEAEDGAFGMLERHIDRAAALVPGVLIYEPTGQPERYLGVDEGLLVKCGEEVLVATASAVEGNDLDDLRRAVQQRFVELDEHERQARLALARLEAGIVRRFVEFRERL